MNFERGSGIIANGELNPVFVTEELIGWHIDADRVTAMESQTREMSIASTCAEAQHDR